MGNPRIQADSTKINVNIKAKSDNFQKPTGLLLEWEKITIWADESERSQIKLVISRNYPI